MRFHDQLARRTRIQREALLGVPIIQGALRGEVSLPSYLAFLEQAWHHVRHTVPLMRACQAALPSRLAWMQPAFDDYVAEESGHDDWILDDIAACGADPTQVVASHPAPATEVMLAYAYDTIARGRPLGFLGMVHVLEGTSVQLALRAADQIQAGLNLPDAAFGYLRSHGTLDVQHASDYAALVDRLDDPDDREAVIHGARMFFRLYGDVFLDLPLPVAAGVAAAGARVSV
jgi:pyrroloquinoline quinone (PQQ) biosynthesis protein C